MYMPAHHEESDPSVLHALIREHPLGTWVLHDGSDLVANHVPFLLDADRGPHGTLVAHVARANPAWRSAAAGAASLVIFQGAQGYITPSWYASKREHGKVVPTWNYAVVQAHGVPRSIDDREWLHAHVSRLASLHESKEAVPWHVSDAPADYIDKLLATIVGIEIEITKLVGKWKVSQNRPDADKRGVVAGLRARGDDERGAMAGIVERFISAR